MSNSNLKYHGDMSLYVTAWQPENNTFIGRDMLRGVFPTVRLATPAELAELYFDHDKFPSDEQRYENAKLFCKDKLDSLREFSNAAGTLLGKHVNLKGVITKDNGEMIAGCAESFIKKPQTQVLTRGQVEIGTIQTPINSWCFANVVQQQDTRWLTADRLHKHLSKKAYSYGDVPVSSDVTSRPLVMMTDAEGNTEGVYLHLRYDDPRFSGQPGQQGIDLVVMNDYNHRVVAAVAGRIGKELDSFLGFDSLLQNQKEAAAEIHKLVKNDVVDVCITPGFQTYLMPEITEEVLLTEREQTISGPFMGRGYFDAHVVLESFSDAEAALYPDRFLPAYVSNVVADLPLLNPENDYFKKLTPSSLVEKSVKIALNHDSRSASARGEAANQLSQQEPVEDPDYTSQISPKR